MNLMVTYSNLEQDVAQRQKHLGPDINPVNADVLEHSLTPGGWLKFTNAASLDIRGLADYAGKRYSILSLKQGISSAYWAAAAPLAWPVSNWARGIDIQLQAEALSETGLTALYHNVNFSMSTEPF